MAGRRKREMKPTPLWLYETIAFIFKVVFNTFFRQIQIRGSYKIPRTGPILFVAAPHANQFIDPMIVLIQILYAAHRHVSFLIAQKSYDLRFIGWLASRMLAIPVGRSQDTLRKVSGTINKDGSDPLLIHGTDTKFLSELPDRGYLAVVGSGDMAEVKEVRSDTELVLKREFESPKARSILAKGDASFRVADRIDNSEMFHNVFKHLGDGHCVGVFPEGGSHDRPDLLPLKPGVAIMALGTLADHPDCGLTIVPLGLNYFHPHKFRSRVVIEFGKPLHVNPDYVKEYRDGNGDAKRDATKKLMAEVLDALEMVTITCPDYETLMIVQAGQRLYRPSKHIPLSLVVEFTRRFIQGYNVHKNNPRVMELKKDVQDYNRRLQIMGLRDHQVNSATKDKPEVLLKLIWRFVFACSLWVLCIPGALLFAPVVVATKVISYRKAKAALKASSVKIQARDVIATWKVLVALWLTPSLFILHSLLAAYYVFSVKSYWTFGWVRLFLFLGGAALAQFCLCYATLIIWEAGLDLFRSLWPLMLALSPVHKDSLEQVREQRKNLVFEITEVVNELGPEMFPDIGERIERSEKDHEEQTADPRMDLRSLAVDEQSGDYNLGDIPVFSTEQLQEEYSRHSRGGSRGSRGPRNGDALATGADFNKELSKRINLVMKDD